MIGRAAFVLWTVTLSAVIGLAQSAGCPVPDNMTKDQKLPCVRASTIMLDQPMLTPVQLANGPDFDAAQPDKTRFLYFKPRGRSGAAAEVPKPPDHA
jgi:hypothetical protein